MNKVEKAGSGVQNAQTTDRILSSNKTAWKEKLAQVQIEDRALEVTIVKNGIILPVRKKDFTEVQCGGAFDGVFEGGVVTKRFKFVAGATRHTKKPKCNYSCNFSYKPSTPVRKYDETVVFGGVVYGHYGHLITDGLARMWWLTENLDSPLKLVFVVMPGESTASLERLLTMAGVGRERYEFIDEPRQYREILVPEEAVFSLEGHANRAWLSFFDLLVKRSEKLSSIETYPMIYFTRSQWIKSDGINEEYYEEFFASQGYRVIAPEKLALEDQIKLYANATHIACTMGTLSHAALFAKNGTKLTCLLRCDTVVMQQLIVNEVRSLDWIMFDAHANVLPTIQGKGAYLYAPTKQFRTYLARVNVDYPASEELRRQIVHHSLEEYLELWLRTYEDPESFRAIFKEDATAVLASVKTALQDEALDRNKYPTYQDYKIEFLSRQNERRLARRVKRLLRTLGVKV